MILRQNNELSSGDFVAHPFWHWCEADVDVAQYPESVETESTFRAHAASYPVLKSALGYARAMATLADGRKIACCVFQPGDSHEIEFGFFLHPKGQIHLSHRILGESSEQLVEQIKWLTDGEPGRLTECFPAQCRVEEGVLSIDNATVEMTGFDCIHIIGGELFRRTLP